MAIQQTLVGLENRFGGRASTLSRAISRDDRIEADESSWLRLGAPFPMQSVRVHNRASAERRINTDIAEDLIQAALGDALPGSAEFRRDVSIGAMYTDDLPISGHAYSNIFVVVSFDLNVDIPLPRDAHVFVELYYGWRQRGDEMALAEDWYHSVGVRNVGPVRRASVKREVTRLLTVASRGSSSAGIQIRNGLAPLFSHTDIRNWYVIPGDGSHNSQDNDIVVKHDASFFVV